MKRWKFESLTDWNDVWSEGHLQRWTEHFHKFETLSVFSHPILMRAWVNTYMPLRDMTPIFVWGVSEDGCVAFLPLVRWRKNWKNAFEVHIVPCGYSDFDYHNPIANQEIDANYWIELQEYLSANFSFDHLSIDGITDAVAIGEGWSKDEICPYLSLEGISSEDDLFKFLKTSLRGDIRRQIRRLNEIAPLNVKEYHSWEEIPAETFSAFMHHHAMRWPNAYKAPKFHENLLRYGLKEGVVHFSALRVGEVEVAWHLGYEHAGRYFYYMPCGHSDYSKYSPVKIHLFHLIARAAERGYTVFDHLRGEENYKDGWSSGAQHVSSKQIHSQTPSTRMKSALLRFREGIIRR